MYNVVVYSVVLYSVVLYSVVVYSVMVYSVVVYSAVVYSVLVYSVVVYSAVVYSVVVYSAWRSEIATHHVIKYNTPIHNILSTAPQLGISQKALETLSKDGNVIPKHVGATIHN
jgi:hypothetical protein